MIQLFAPLVTPFQSDESVDEEAFVENISLYEKAPLDGYVINGSSGEADEQGLEHFCLANLSSVDDDHDASLTSQGMLSCGVASTL